VSLRARPFRSGLRDGDRWADAFFDASLWARILRDVVERLWFGDEGFAMADAGGMPPFAWYFPHFLCTSSSSENAAALAGVAGLVGFVW
jgi:hypothetical protein